MISSQELSDSHRRILVVDDEPAVRVFLAAFLEQYEFAVRTAPDSTSALALLQAEPVDVILVDLNMPGISGVEMAVEVRRINPHIPIALITGTPAAVQPVTLKQTGISLVFAKPFNLDELLAWLRSLPH